MSTRSFSQIFSENATATMSDIRYKGASFLRQGPENTDPWRDQGVTPSTLTYSEAENSYSGTDVTAVIVFNEEMVILGNLQTITYSIHREKMPVRTLGRTYPKDYVRGPRTIAGSAVFVQFDEAPLHMLYRFFENKKLENEHRFSSPLSDEIPPFDMMLIFNNEYGKASIIRLYGVEIVDEGGTYSINDIYSENVMQFIARDVDPMFSDSRTDEVKKLMFQKMTQGKILDPHYNSMLEYKAKLEGNLSRVESEIAAVADLANRNLRSSSRAQIPDPTVSNADDLNRAQRQNLERLTARRQYEQLLTKKERILNELKQLELTIANYEKTSMTWDMNSALEPNYTGTPAFAVNSRR